MDIAKTNAPATRRKRRLLVGGAIAVGIALAGLALATLDPGAPRLDHRALFIDTVQEGELVRRVRGPGILVPRDQRFIAAAVEGRVERVNVRPGTAVSADTVLVDLSNPEAEQLAAEAQAAVAAGRAELAALRVKLQSDVLEQRARIAEARAARETARLEAEADAKLVERGLVPGLQAARSRIAAEQHAVRLDVEEERLANLAGAVRAQLAAQALRVDQLAGTWERRRAQVDALAVRAGLDGVLQSLTAEPGQRITAGTEIARVARAGALRAELRIPEIDARDLAAGQAAQIDTRNGVVAGKVERVDPAVRDGAVRVDVAIAGALPDGARADLSVDGVVEIERLAHVRHLARPVNARPDATVALYRVDAGGDALRVPVRLGKASADRVVVLDGLAPGDRVIVSDVSEYGRHERLTVR